MSDRNRTPSHYIYVVTGDGDDSHWIKIGAAWPNLDGKGFTLSLDAAPLSGRLVMRAPKADEKGGQQ